jgi:hypothetical protein
LALSGLANQLRPSFIPPAPRVSRRHQTQAFANAIGYAGEIIAPAELDVIEL